MKYVCDVCDWVYDEEKGYPEGGIAPGTKWEDVPDDFVCPLCFVGKELFTVMAEQGKRCLPLFAYKNSFMRRLQPIE